MAKRLSSITAGTVNAPIGEAMKKLHIIPDVISSEPTEFLNVTYGKDKADRGNELTPTIVKDKPNVSWEAEEGSFYTLIMTDPDAPSRNNPKMREWHHWLIGNIPGNQIDKGEVLTDYVGSGPPQGSGLHRYVFLVFKQPKKLTFTEGKLSKTTGKGREKFSTKNFVKKYGLGSPIAGNMFQAKYDDYVPKLYAQLKN